MKVLRQILFAVLILCGAAFATFAQKGDDRKVAPKKGDPPVIVVQPDKKNNKNNNNDNRERPRDNKKSKPKKDNDEAFLFVVGSSNILAV